MFKDEAGGKRIVEFVGLRAKLYSYKMFYGSEDKKVKGVKECYKKRILLSMTIKSDCFSGRNNI